MGHMREKLLAVFICSLIAIINMSILINSERREMVRTAHETLLMDSHKSTFEISSMHYSTIKTELPLIIDYLTASMLFNIWTVKHDAYTSFIKDVKVSNYRRRRRHYWLYRLLHPLCLGKPYISTHHKQE